MSGKLVEITNPSLVPRELQRFVKPALDQFKVELAAELGIPDYDLIDKGELTSRQLGRIGGNMTKRMVGFAEAVLAFYYRKQLEGSKKS